MTGSDTDTSTPILTASAASNPSPMPDAALPTQPTQHLIPTDSSPPTMLAPAHRITGIDLVPSTAPTILSDPLPRTAIVDRSDTLIQSTPSLRPKPKTGRSIPVETYLLILSFLGKSELIRLLRTSRFFHHLTAPIIYHLLYAFTEFSLPGTVHPLSVRVIPTPPHKPTSQPHTTILADTMDQSGIHSAIPEVIYKHPLASFFEYITHLTLPQHNHYICANFLPLDLPALQSLRIRPNGIDDGISLCDGVSETGCPLISNLRPRQLIVGGGTTGLTGSFAGLWTDTSTSFPPCFVKHLVVLVGLWTGYEGDGDDSIAVLQSLPDTVERLSFVMLTGERAWWDIESILSDPSDSAFLDALECLETHGMAAESAMRAAVGQAQVIEVVGSEVVEDFMDDGVLGPRNLKTIMRAELNGRLYAKGCSSKEAARRSDSIRFTDEETFGQQEGWYAAEQAESREATVEKVRMKACVMLQAVEDAIELALARQVSEDICEDHNRGRHCSDSSHHHNPHDGAE